MPESHALAVKEVFAQLDSGVDGLSNEKAQSRLEKYGLNELKKEEGESKIKLFFNQFKSFLIIILILAAAISYFIASEHGEDPIDAIVIAIIIILNAIIGFVQEYRAEKSLEALKKMTATYARIVRGGVELKVPTTELVPGDIILLEAGDKIPADARLFEVHELRVDEAALTGESLPVEKSLDNVKKDSALGDRLNMVYSGTLVSYGKAKAIVVATGMETELGKIASMVQKTEHTETPLQRRLGIVGKQIGLGVLIICAIVFAVGLLRIGTTTENIVDMFLNAVSLAVAAIPEGLPAVVVMSLALGTQRMVKRNAIIRKLPAVETLGSCDVICSDKTGTFTKNEMTVRRLFVNGEDIEVTGAGYGVDGELLKDNKKVNIDSIKGFSRLLRGSILCNNAALGESVLGDPTEVSLLVLGEKTGMKKSYLENAYSRIDEIQFDSERKLMTTINGEGKKKIVYTKGATEKVLDLCTQMYDGKRLVKLTGEMRKDLLEKNDELANDALRVLAVAYKEGVRGDAEKNLTFLGLIGMIDPPRDEVKDALEVCKTAGIDVKMITGDHAITARAIAREIGLPEGDVVTGVELDGMSREELEKRVEHITVFARVNPEHKLKIVEALKKNGHIVAMTGDGVNDAPALKRADIGIAMGITGTEVSKEASSMVLTDDNFSTIVAAIEEGRTIYDNIKKFIQFLLSSNMGEVMTIFFGILLFPLRYTVLLPAQILWINLVTDGAPALALGVEPRGEDIMKKPPRPTNENIFSGLMLNTILLVGVVMAVGTLGVYYMYNPSFLGIDTPDAILADTMAFTTLMMFQMVNVFNSRSEKGSILKKDILKNKWLVIAVIGSIVLQLAVLYIPFLSAAFGTVPLVLSDWLIVIGVSLSLLVVVELYKWVERRN